MNTERCAFPEAFDRLGLGFRYGQCFANLLTGRFHRNFDGPCVNTHKH